MVLSLRSFTPVEGSYQSIEATECDGLDKSESIMGYFVSCQQQAQEGHCKTAHTTFASSAAAARVGRFRSQMNPTEGRFLFVEYTRRTPNDRYATFLVDVLMRLTVGAAESPAAPFGQLRARALATVPFDVSRKDYGTHGGWEKKKQNKNRGDLYHVEVVDQWQYPFRKSGVSLQRFDSRDRSDSDRIFLAFSYRFYCRRST